MPRTFLDQIKRNEFISMWLDLARRLAVMMLSVAIVTGFIAHKAHSEPHHDKFTITAVIAGNHLATGVRDGCADDQGVKFQISCAITCASIAAVLPLATLFVSVDVSVLSFTVDLSMMDHAIPPDPYPPKSYALI